MPGESPLNLMRAGRQQVPRRPIVSARRRRLWPILAPVAILVVLALGWCWLWYYAASVAGHTLAAWVEREAAAGRYYSCGSQSIGGFPFRIEVHCADAAGELKNNQPPFSIRAKDITFIAQVYHPTLLVGDFTGPLSLADPGEPPKFVATWSFAQLSVQGVPPDPQRVSVTLDRPRFDQIVGANQTMVFQADHAEVDLRIIAGSARNNPVIEMSARFTAATAPTLHPLLAEPVRGELDTVVRGFKDLAPKPWPARFREMQAAGGDIEIRYLRVERSDAIIVGTGTLTVNEHGKLDGLIRVAMLGVEHIVPLLGLDQVIGQGIDRLTGGGSQPAQGLGTLDRLVPGLSGAVRAGANASLIETIKKMGQPTQIDDKPAVALPLRVANGTVYLGLIPLGDLPSMF